MRIVLGNRVELRDGRKGIVEDIDGSTVFVEVPGGEWVEVHVTDIHKNLDH